MMGAFFVFVLNCTATIGLLLCHSLVRSVILFNLCRLQRTTEELSFTEILCGSPFNSAALCGQIHQFVNNLYFANTIRFMKPLDIQSKFSNKKRSLSVTVPVLSFKQDKAYIIYCPALDLSGSGNTKSEAKESFEIVVTESLNYSNRKNMRFTNPG